MRRIVLWDASHRIHGLDLTPTIRTTRSARPRDHPESLENRSKIDHFGVSEIMEILEFRREIRISGYFGYFHLFTILQMQALMWCIFVRCCQHVESPEIAENPLSG